MRYQTKQDQLEALIRPFPRSEVKTRDEGGSTLSYYEASTIMKRLVDVMGSGFSIESGRIERYAVEGKPRRLDMEVIVTLTWVDGSQSRLTGWGSADIQYSKKDEWRIVSDFMKAALTDGTKVGLSKVGLGSELYDSTYRASLAAAKEQDDQAARQKALTTCQECGGEIAGGKVGGRDRTAQEIVTATRKQFKKRLCLECAHSAKAAGKAVA